MKKLLIATALTAVTATTALVPQKSQAFGVVNLIVTGNLDYVGVPRTYQDMLMTTLCIVLLPICILEDGAKAQETMTHANLVANGFSESEAQNILSGHQAVVSSLSKSSTSEDIQRAISEVASVNADYNEFVQVNK